MKKIKFIFKTLYIFDKYKVVVVPHYFNNKAYYYDEYYHIKEPEWTTQEKYFVKNNASLEEKEALIKKALSPIYPGYEIKFCENSFYFDHKPFDGIVVENVEASVEI